MLSQKLRQFTDVLDEQRPVGAPGTGHERDEHPAATLGLSGHRGAGTPGRHVRLAA
jgi:hypothetical protein